MVQASDCDSDHYLVEPKFRERPEMNKQTTHRFHMERCTLKKLNETEDKEKYLC
jgi:hypothetical protein